MTYLFESFFEILMCSAEQLVDAFRKKLLLRGARSIIGIGRLFKIMDDNRSGTLDLAEFTKGVHESKLDITI